MDNNEEKNQINEDLTADIGAFVRENLEPEQGSAPSEKNPPRDKTRWIESFGAKTAAFILCVVFAAIFIVTLIGAIFMIDQNVYQMTKAETREQFFESFFHDDASRALDLFVNEGGETVDKSLGGTNASCAIFDANKELIHGSIKSEASSYVIGTGGNFHETDAVTGAETAHEYTLSLYISKSLTKDDGYVTAAHTIDLVYSLRYWVYAIAFFSLLACILLFIFLMCASGHRRGLPGISSSPITKIPLDLFAAAYLLTLFLVIQYTIESIYHIDNLVTIIVVYVLVFIVLFSLVLSFCISLATRVKLGKFWKNTIIYKILHLLWVVLKKCGHGLAYLFRSLPLIWKSVLFMLVFGLIFIFSLGIRSVFLLLLCAIFLFVLVCYISIALRKLQMTGRKIAKGDLSAQVNTKYMLWDFKEHGENLNSIGLGMTRAVDERMKSERMKTELITNVSHDIKTPLTSIINYVDLISKEDTENEKIIEYVEILSRQSERLKKLIEDLVDASKASTGNLDLILFPCDIGVLLAQTAGEYEAKLQESDLELVITKPEDPVMIMADGKLLWRIFDNLMGNACKYSQPGTRVYMGLEQQGNHAVITFKNISKFPLNITAEELMERFVRGDSSRHTEGSGLGLSIARSLTELLQGKLELFVDGDFFKVILSFRTLN